jgi:hypothetical protein
MVAPQLASHEPPADADVVALPGPGAPADHGLASLGLIMQLAGRTTSALAALAASIAWLDGRLGARLGDHGGWLMLAFALCIARSQLHRIAGRDLTYPRRTADGGPTDPLAAMRRYAGFGIAHAIAIGLIAAGPLDRPPAAAAGIAAALAVWPVALAAIARAPRFARLRRGIPLGEDRGLESASIAMTVLGAYGALSTGAVVALIGALSRHHRQHGWGAMLIVVFALLLVRASLQLRAGLAGLRDRSFDRPAELAGRYAAFGVISAFCVGGVLSLLAMAERLAPDAIVSVAATCWLLVTWPMIVKRYFAHRQFAELLAGDRVPHRRAPDAGLTGLGWLLAGHAALVAGALIWQVTARPQLGRALDHALALTGLAVGRGGSAIDAGIGAGIAAGTGAWLAAAVVALEVAAAAALIRMSDRRRAIATIYALFAAAVAVGPALPALRAVADHASPGAGIQLLPLAAQLVLPITALVLVHREIAPAARARYRRRPDI